MLYTHFFIFIYIAFLFRYIRFFVTNFLSYPPFYKNLTELEKVPLHRSPRAKNFYIQEGGTLSLYGRVDFLYPRGYATSSFPKLRLAILSAVPARNLSSAAVERVKGQWRGYCPPICLDNAIS